MTVDDFIRQFPDWESFFRAASMLPDSARRGSLDKGHVFERFTQLYLRTLPEYQSKLKHVWRAHDEVPPAVFASLGLPALDEGIDLVAETRDGQFWAIQCKFRTDTNRRLTVTELATFANLTFNHCQGFSVAVVAHTAAKPVLKRYLLRHTTEIGLDRWLAIEPDDWARIHKATSRKAPPPVPRSPRPHQQDAIEAAAKHYIDRANSRGRMIMPCGTGKSLTAFWIAQRLKAHSILVAVPSLALIKQSLADWTREFLANGETPDWLCVCSDDTIGNLDQDEFVGGVYELGVDATTNSAEVAKFLSSRNGKRRIVFVTYQSGAIVAKACRRARFQFDLGVMDEAHRTVGSREKAFAHLLSSKNIAIKVRLFMTATERVVRGAGDEVVSMHDVKVYGERFHQLSFKAAIEARPPIISDYRILTITVTDALVHDLIRKNRYLRVHKKLGEREAQALAASITLQRAFREQGIKHAISFHRSIRAAEEFRDQHEKIVAFDSRARRPSCFQISSHKTAGERSQILRAFARAVRGLISNARCLQEGVDIPAVDCVLFADPKQSVVDIVQAAGRAMRPHPGKRFGYIVVPIIVPSGMKFAQFAESTEFKQVARVVTALSTQDGRIAEELRAVAAKRRGDGRIVVISGEVPIRYRIGLDEFRERIQLKVWERVGIANWREFVEARAFVRSLGLRNSTEWVAYCRSGKCPPDIPTTPSFVYRDRGWVSFGDWLGTGRVYRQFRPFQQARAFVRQLGFKSRAQWSAYSKSAERPRDIPANPEGAYRNTGWAGVGDWLGTGVIATNERAYRPFREARSFVRRLGLKGASDWRAYCKGGRRPPDIPTNPWITYRDRGWVSFGDWFGTGTIANYKREYRSFREARAYVRRLGLKSEDEWFAYLRSGKRPPDIPANPWVVYRDRGWLSRGDWFGTGSVSNRSRKFRPFHQARAFVRSLRLKSQPEWFAYAKSGKRPSDIPTNPHRTYSGRGWTSYGDWIGTGALSNRDRVFRPFRQARAFVRGLGLKTEGDWRAYCASGRRPPDIPSTPGVKYRATGWKNWSDFLGN